MAKEKEIQEIKDQKKGAGLKTAEQKMEEKIDENNQEWQIIKLV